MTKRDLAEARRAIPAWDPAQRIHRIAVHEAGHAVACVAHRIPIDHATLWSDDPGADAHVSFQFPRNVDILELPRRRALDFGVVFLAGPAAEMRLFDADDPRRETCHAVAQSDYEGAEYVMRLADEPDGGAEMMSDVSKRVETFLSRYRAAIAAVARELLTADLPNDRLAGRSIRHIVRLTAPK